MPADYSRIHRLLKILTLIQSQRGWGPERLAKECHTTVRTIYRDMRMLEGAGIPYFHDPETGGYIVRNDFFMPALSLTLDESLALVALAQHVGGKEQVPMMSAAAKAIVKIRCNLPAKIQNELAEIDPFVNIKLPPVSKADGITDVYQRVQAALRGRRALLCQYASVGKADDGDGAAFLFEPYTLFFSKRAWYTVGWHQAHKDVRCLKLCRFTACRLSDRTYKIPKSFSLDRHLGDAWQMIRGRPRYEIEVWFDPEFAETIADTHWHKTQDVTWNEDGSILFHCTVDGLEEIVWWVLSMGPHCVVQKPVELAQRVKALADQMAERYPAADNAAHRGTKLSPVLKS